MAKAAKQSKKSPARTVDPELRTWIAENILLNCTDEQLVNVMVGIGVPQAVAQKEVETARKHPYMAAAHQVNEALQRRESFMKTRDYYQRMDPEYLTLKPQKLLPYRKFLTEHVYANRPGLFKHAVDRWPAMKWTPRNLVKKVGAETMVQIQHGRDADAEYEINSPLLRKTVPFGEFVDQVESTVTNNFYLTANNHALADTPLSVLINDVANIGDGYLDMSQTARRMFLWLGPEGIVTPLHHDLTHNIFIQIYGRKRFYLIPPDQVPYLYNHRAVFSRVNLLKPDLQRHANFARVGMIEVTVEPGDFLYIPAGWWHHVEGLTTSISLSFINFANLPNLFVEWPGNN